MSTPFREIREIRGKSFSVSRVSGDPSPTSRIRLRLAHWRSCPGWVLLLQRRWFRLSEACCIIQRRRPLCPTAPPPLSARRPAAPPPFLACRPGAPLPLLARRPTASSRGSLARRCDRRSRLEGRQPRRRCVFDARRYRRRRTLLVVTNQAPSAHA